MNSSHPLVHSIQNHIWRQLLYAFFLVPLLSIAPSHASDKLQVMHRAPDSSNDKRQDYIIALIQLSLSKTLKKNETLELSAIPPMNSARARYALNTNYYPNLILELSYEDDMKELANIDYAPFPAELGALSYRTCFASSLFTKSNKPINSIDDIKPLTFGTGVGWPDTRVLKDHQLKVMEISHYDNIFKMLAGNRFDLLCRGSSEILNEYLTFNATYSLNHNKTFALYYRLPRFLFVHKNNQELKKRLETGLKMAFEDGSLIKLWQEKFADSIKFSSLINREIIYLENKNIKRLNKDYEQYLLPIEHYLNINSAPASLPNP